MTICRVLEIFFPLSVILTDYGHYHLKFVSPEKSPSVQKKPNVYIKFLWIQVVANFLHNSLLLTGHLNFLTWSSAIYKFYSPNVYTDHSMSFTYIVKAFLKLQKAFNRLRLSHSYGIHAEFCQIYASCYVNMYRSFGLT